MPSARIKHAKLAAHSCAKAPQQGCVDKGWGARVRGLGLLNWTFLVRGEEREEGEVRADAYVEAGCVLAWWSHVGLDELTIT